MPALAAVAVSVHNGAVVASGTFLIALAVTGTSALILYWPYFGWQRRKRDWLDSFETQRVVGPYVVEVTPDFLRMITPHYRADAEWPIVSHAVSVDAYFFVFISGTDTPLMIPRRSFSNDREYHRFVATVHQFRSNHPGVLTECPFCGYDLKGGSSFGCPECGWSRPQGPGG